MLSMNRVTKTYPTRTGRHRVLDDVTLAIGRNHRVGVLGRNGSGKSTLVRIMAGASQPDSGKIVRSMSVSWPLAFGGAFQGSLTGYDNIRFICRVYGVEFKAAAERVEAFAELGMYLREPVKTYSAGMRARLAFGLSLAAKFEAVLIDEIVAVGDARFQAKCRREIFESSEERALVLVSHDESFIREYCTRFGVMTNGRFVEYDSRDEAMDAYRRGG